MFVSILFTIHGVQKNKTFLRAPCTCVLCSFIKTSGDNCFADVWMVVDVDNLPEMGNLTIYGVLEIPVDRDFVLYATYIFIQGGRLLIGTEDAPYTGNGKIILRGRHSTREVLLPNDNGNSVNMGSKVLGEYLRAIEETHVRLKYTMSQSF